jgi:hypothetical protein
LIRFPGPHSSSRYIPFTTVLKQSKTKPTVTNQKAYAEMNGMVMIAPKTPRIARIKDIHQKFFVGAFIS